jgi:hypothetical protein
VSKKTLTGVDSFQILGELLQRHPEPTREQALEIMPALTDIYVRLMRVREVAPTVCLPPRTVRLLELVGIKYREPQKAGKG